MNFTTLDLFTGIGAFALGFEREGFTSLAHVEIDPNCRKLLASKWPGVPQHDDVSTFDPDSIACPSIVTFGSPCQDLSVAGQRRGMAGERSGLFYEATRIIRKLVPRGLEFALWENVEGAFSSHGRRDFAGVLAELADCGAVDIAWSILDCQYWGLAQRRRRIFLVADFRGERAGEILALSEGLRGHPAPRREKGQEVAPCVRGGTASGSNEPENKIAVCAKPLGAHHPRTDLDNETYVLAHGQANAEQVRDGEPSLTCNHEAPILAHMLHARAKGAVQIEETFIPIQSVNMVRDKKQNGIDIGKPGDEMFTLTGRDQHAVVGFDSWQGGDTNHGFTEDGTPPLRPGERNAIAFEPRYYTRDDKTGGSPKENVDLTNCAKAGDSAPVVAFQTRIGRNGRGQPEPIAPALNGSDAGATSDMRPCVATQTMVRRLMPIECERLMGFPDGWTQYFHSGGKCSIIAPCQIFAGSRDVAETSLIVNAESVSCTTRDSGTMEVTISRHGQTNPSTSAASVQGRLEMTEHGGCVPGTTNHGSVTAILFNQTKIWTPNEKSNGDAPTFTNASLRLLLAESFSEARLSIILTWMSAMISLKTFTFAPAEQNTCRCMIHWNAPGRYSSIGQGELCLSAVGITQLSDSVRYRMIGNSAAVPIVSWIARRIRNSLQ